MLEEGIVSIASVLGYTQTLLQVIVHFMWNLRTDATFWNLINWKFWGFSGTMQAALVLILQFHGVPGYVQGVRCS